MQMNNRSNLQRMTVIGVFAALLAVLSQIAIPLPSGVPVTLQTFAVALAGFVLGPAGGALCVSVYLVLGGIGLPVFAQMMGGAGMLLGMTGGYLWGFLPMAYLCGLGVAKKSKAAGMVLGFCGLAACHVLGTLHFALLTASGPLQAFLTASAPYLIKDGVSVVMAFAAAKAIVLSLKKAGFSV